MRIFLASAMLGASTLALAASFTPAQAQGHGMTEEEAVSDVANGVDEVRARFDRMFAQTQANLAAGDCRYYRKGVSDLRFYNGVVKKAMLKLYGDKAQTGTLATPEWAREKDLIDSLPETCTPKPQKPISLPKSGVTADGSDVDSVVPDLSKGVMLDNGEMIREPGIDELISLVKKAAADCDRERYDRWRRKLQEGANKERDDLVKSGLEDPYTDPRMAKLQKVLSEYPPHLECGKDGGRDGKTTFRLQPGYRINYLPRRGFLAHEAYGATIPELNLWTPDGTSVGAAMEAILEFWLCENFFGGMSFGWNHASDHQSVDMIDPGDVLDIPGAEGGASGYSLGYNPYNIVRDAHYSRSQTHYNGALYGGGFYYIPGTDTRLRIDGFVRYDSGSFDEAFGGSIPGYGRDFGYDTRIDTERTTLGAKVSARKYFGRSDTGAFYVGGSGGLDFSYTNASGWDTSRFTGYPDSMRKLSADDFGVGFHAGAKIGYRFENGFDLSAGVTYGREPGSPYVVRNGTDPSQLELGTAEHLIWTIGLSKSF